MPSLPIHRSSSLLLLVLGASAFVACSSDDPVEIDETADGGRSSSSSSGHADGGSSTGSSSGQSSSSGNTSGGSSSSSSSSSSGTPVPTYSVGGTLTGLTGPSIVLQDNGGDALTLEADGPFTFAGKLVDQTDFAITVATQPAGNLCTVQEDGAGTIDGADYTSAHVTCVPTYTVGGTVIGLKGPLTIGNGADTITVSADGDFTLPTGQPSGAPYLVGVTAQPPGQLCTVDPETESGSIGATSITTVAVTCRDLGIAINEVYARPATLHWGDANADGFRDSAQDEFVEIMNDEDIAVSLDGLQLRTGTAPNPIKRFTFPVGTTVPSKGRVVVFGGGTPTGSFRGAATFSAPLLLTDAPAAGASFSVQLYASAALTVDEYLYASTDFGSSCTTTCASRTRVPEAPDGVFTAHTTVAGVLTSPGAAQADAVPKLLPTFSLPVQTAAGISITSFFRAQLNMTMGANLLTESKLYASSCAALGPQLATTTTSELSGSAAHLLPNAPLAYATTYCLTAGMPTGAAGAPLDLTGATQIELTTRAQVSAPATGVVISQIGTGLGTANEFVELYNASNATADLSGWFLQRRTASGGTSCWATLPATSIPAHGFYLVGSTGYVPGTVAADATTAPGSALTGSNESVLLLSGGSCTTATPDVVDRVDAVSYGTLTDAYAGLYLPAIAAPVTAVRRKACLDSTGGIGATGIGAGGGEELAGSAEHIGASDADFIPLLAPAPRNAATAVQTPTCTQ